MLADSFIFNIEFVELERKELLPSYSAIYYVINESKQILYIGQSRNLNRRWNGEKPHHRYEQLCSLGSKTNEQIYIYYERIDKAELLTIEKKQILKYQPLLNNTPVQKYFNLEVNKNQKYSARQKDCTNYMNRISTILSDFKTLSNKSKSDKEIQHDLPSVNDINNKLIMENNPVEIKTDRHQIKRFTRKFITLKSNKIDLLLEL